jgi:hypothetical protein
MSWTDVFPVLEDEIIESFGRDATPQERDWLDRCFSIPEIFNRKEEGYLVSTSLYSREDKRSFECVSKHSRVFLRTRKDVVVRVYLAGELHDWVEPLVESGCEVYLMNELECEFPGACIAWKLLALSEQGRRITILDPERFEFLKDEVGRTIAMEALGLGCWRTAPARDLDAKGAVAYRPFTGASLGIKGGFPVEVWLRAFTWAMMHDLLSLDVQLPGCGTALLSCSNWRGVGYGDLFLAVAAYPRIVSGGVLSFVFAGSQSNLLLLDIEYVTWACPTSEIVIVSSSICCT